MNKTIKLRPHASNYQALANASTPAEKILRDIFQSRDAKFGKHNDYRLGNMHLPQAFQGLAVAVELLARALEQQDKILVIGDFDADGATSTALAIRCLRAFGGQSVDYLVPNRFVFGYGLTPEIVEVAAKKKPDIIVTVDNGISSIAGVEAAKAYGIKVIVTDHHLPAKETPAADAIVNPNQYGCEFPSKNLAGVGVIFYVMSALRKLLREKNWFEKLGLPEPNMGSYLDLVALGTVADVVPLDYNNRVLIAAGLKKIRSNKAIAGINALMQIAGKDVRRASSGDLGYAIGPRINAAGRLDDMSLGIRCLLSDNFYDALQLAKELDNLNRDRKLIESSMQTEALEILQNLSQQEIEEYHHGICLYQPDWHQGVIGILASRIKDRLHRPTIIFAQNDQQELKGSGRSIVGVHLRDVLDEIAAANPGLIEKFGGHAMAAGMSLKRDSLDRFKKVFNRVVETHLTEDNKESVVFSDGELPEELICLDLAQTIREAGPWGQNFSEPVFHGVFHIVQQRIVGEKHLKLIVSRETYSNTVFDAIAFNIDVKQWPDNNAREICIAYHLDVNEYKGDVSVQLLVIYLEAV